MTSLMKRGNWAKLLEKFKKRLFTKLIKKPLKTTSNTKDLNTQQKKNYMASFWISCTAATEVVTSNIFIVINIDMNRSILLKIENYCYKMHCMLLVKRAPLLWARRNRQRITWNKMYLAPDQIERIDNTGDENTYAIHYLSNLQERISQWHVELNDYFGTLMHQQGYKLL
jgi:hypothetical protein